MKRKALVLLIVVLIFTFVACEDNTVTKTDKEQTEVAVSNNESSVDTADLVTVAYDSGLMEIENYMSCNYRIPKINLPGNEATLINQEIYNLYEKGKSSGGNYSSEYSTINYSWSVVDEILSLKVACENPHCSPMSETHIYNLNVSTGAKASKQEVVTAAGFSESEFCDKVSDALEKTYPKVSGYMLEGGESELYYQKLDETLTEDNINQAEPYFNESGQLCVSAKMQMMLDPGVIGVCCNLVTGENYVNYEDPLFAINSID